MSNPYLQTWAGSYGRPFPPHLHPQPWDGSYGTPFPPRPHPQPWDGGYGTPFPPHPYHGTQVNSPYPQNPFALHFSPRHPPIYIQLYLTPYIDSTTPIHHAGNLPNTYPTYVSSGPLVASPMAMTPAGCSTVFSRKLVRPPSKRFPNMNPTPNTSHDYRRASEEKTIEIHDFLSTNGILELDLSAPDFKAEYLEDGKEVSVSMEDLAMEATHPLTHRVTIKAVTKHRDLQLNFIVLNLLIKTKPPRCVTVGDMLTGVHKWMRSPAEHLQLSDNEDEQVIVAYRERCTRALTECRQTLEECRRNIDYFGGEFMFTGFRMDREGVFYLLVGPPALARSE